MSCRVTPASLVLLAALSGCAGQGQVAAPAPLPLPAPVRATAPLPPDRAAPNLSIPARLADGSYATLNRNLSAAGTVWHLRAAFNVAALNCADPTLAPAYNKLLATHRAALASAHATLAREHGSAGFDAAMTRVYNYFAQPPVLARFCATAAPLLHQATALPAAALGGFAPGALAAIDQPFSQFYARYDDYRTQLAAWRAGTPVTPRLAYDPAVFASVGVVTGGRRVLAAR